MTNSHIFLSRRSAVGGRVLLCQLAIFSLCLSFLSVMIACAFTRREHRDEIELDVSFVSPGAHLFSGGAVRKQQYSLLIDYVLYQYIVPGIQQYGLVHSSTIGAVIVVVVVVVFTLNRSFYPTTSAVPPVSFLILHPRDTRILWSDSETEKNQTPKNQGRQIKC